MQDNLNDAQLAPHRTMARLKLLGYFGQPPRPGTTL